jgi:hypothetical protein
MRMTVAVAAGALLVGNSGCTDFLNKFTTNSTAPVLKIAAGSMDAESDVTLAREAAPGNLKTVDGFLLASPENPDLLELVSRSYVQYAFAFLEDDLEELPPGDSPARTALVDRCTMLYDRAHALAVRLVALDRKDFPSQWSGTNDARDQALARARRDAAPGLFLAGLALGSSINLHRDNMDRVAELPRAIAALERSHALDPTYFNHGAAMALATVYSSQGAAVGGDPKKAKAYFDEVFQGTGGKYLMAKVLYARFYATQIQDRALFESTLKEVLATPATVWPEQRLANELAHRRAARYLRQVEDLF